MRGIAAIKPGATTGDIGHAIQTYVEAQHMSVVRDFCGHGLGRLFHDEPNIVHVGRPGEGIVLKPGMFFTVEPMINLGRAHVKVLSDGWTAVTRDRSLSAQFEHSSASPRPASRFSRCRRRASTSRRIRPDSGPAAARRLQKFLIRSSLAASAPATADAAGAELRAKSHAGKEARQQSRPRRGHAALSRPSRTAARALSRRRHRRFVGLRAVGIVVVPRPAAARRQAVGQIAVGEIRLVR